MYTRNDICPAEDYMKGIQMKRKYKKVYFSLIVITVIVEIMFALTSYGILLDVKYQFEMSEFELHRNIVNDIYDIIDTLSLFFIILSVILILTFYFWRKDNKMNNVEEIEGNNDMKNR